MASAAVELMSVSIARSGLRRPFDRLVVPGAVERVARETLDNLERRFAELSDA
jgi:hypothetical protein